MSEWFKWCVCERENEICMQTDRQTGRLTENDRQTENDRHTYMRYDERYIGWGDGALERKNEMRASDQEK